MSTTGDLRNNLLKLQKELKIIHYNGPFNIFGASKGDPSSLLPILHYILLDYSSILATHFAAKGYELYGKKDARFLEAVYQLLRREFTYRPQLSRIQFFTMGFAERKLILVYEIIHQCKQLHHNLSREASLQKPAQKRQSPKMEEARPMSPQHDQPRDSTRASPFPKNPLGFKQGMNRPFTPEVALASLWQRSSATRHAMSPFPNEADTYHHEYTSPQRTLDLSPATRDAESILNHPPSYAWKTYVPSHYESQNTQEFSKTVKSQPKPLVLSDLEEVSQNLEISRVNHSSFRDMSLSGESSPRMLHSPTGGPLALSSPIGKLGEVTSRRLVFPPARSAFSKPKEDISVTLDVNKNGTPLEPVLKKDQPLEPLVSQSTLSDLQSQVKQLQEADKARQEEVSQLRGQIQNLQDELQRVKNARQTNGMDPPLSPKMKLSTNSAPQAPSLPEYRPNTALQVLLSQAEERMLRTSQFLAKTRAAPPSF